MNDFYLGAVLASLSTTVVRWQSTKSHPAKKGREKEKREEGGRERKKEENQTKWIEGSGVNVKHGARGKINFWECSRGCRAAGRSFRVRSPTKVFSIFVLCELNRAAEHTGSVP